MPDDTSSGFLKKCLNVLIIMALWFPVFFLSVIIIYTYYVYVVVFCANFLINGDPSYKTRGALYIAAFHILLITFLWTYFSTVFSTPGHPSDYENLAIRTQLDDDTSYEPVIEGNRILLPSNFCRFCLVCQYPKPDRTHHCSICKRCQLKMDHHCVWLNNCVGHENYKLFILTMLYGLLLAAFTVITLAQQLIYDAANDSLFSNEIQMLIVVVLGFALFVAAGALLIYHWFWLAQRNKTTIEALDEDDQKRIDRRVARYQQTTKGERITERRTFRNPYDLGSKMNNLKAALGQNPWHWLVPIKDSTNGNGLWFPRQL